MTDALLPSHRLPWPSPRRALVVLRLVVAGVFAAHAIVRLANGTIPRFGGFLEQRGLPNGVALVWVITAVELIAAALLVIGRWTRLAAASLIALLLGGIVLIHAQLGWFVGEHGSGGSEYSVALIAALLVIGANEQED